MKATPRFVALYGSEGLPAGIVDRVVAPGTWRT